MTSYGQLHEKKKEYYDEREVMMNYLPSSNKKEFAMRFTVSRSRSREMATRNLMNDFGKSDFQSFDARPLENEI